MQTIATSILASAMLLASCHTLARNTISIVGSSTVYPFTAVVAEYFGKNTRFRTPKIEATGTGGGVKLFCGGLGAKHPDLTNASRKIKASEIKLCQDNGVSDIIEMKIGYDGIIIASDLNQGKPFDLTTKELFLALAKSIPDVNGKLIANPYTHWNQINPKFPATKIAVLGPPPTSGTRDALVELAFEEGARTIDILKRLEAATDEASIKKTANQLGISDQVYKSIKQNKGSAKAIFKLIAHALREDGAYIEVGENDNLIIQKLHVNPSLIGIFGYSFFDQNRDVIRAHKVNGVESSFESISDGSYPIARSLFVYIKKQHIGIMLGIKEFLNEYTSERAWGEESYLVDKGLIPMEASERTNYRAAVKALQTIN